MKIKASLLPDVKNYQKHRLYMFNRETNKYKFHILIEYVYFKKQKSTESIYKIDEIKEWIKLSQ